MWFKRTGRMLVGVDISSTAVKLIALRQDAGRYWVSGYARCPLREGAVVDRRIHQVEEVTSTLRNAVEQAGLESRRACIAVPASAAITKTLTFPTSLNDEEIEARIELEFDKHIPFPFAEVAFDFQRLGPHASRENQQDVLLVACRQQDVDLFTTALLESGLEPAAVDVETFAIERAFTTLDNQLTQHECVALVDIGAARSAFYVLCRGRMVYHSDISFGSQQLSGVVDSCYGLNTAEADLAKRHAGLLEEEHQREVSGPLVSGLAKQVARCLQLYYTAGHNAAVKRLVLAGGFSKIPRFVEQLAEESGLVVSLANPFVHMSLDPKVDSRVLTGSAPAMLTACGLAMRTQR